MGGWSQYWTATLLFRTWGFALAGTLFLVLLLYVAIAIIADDMQSMQTNSRNGSAVQFWVLAYTGIGVAFGGLMYRVDEISPFFKVLSFSSAGYYTQSGIMSVVLHQLRDLDIDSGVGRQTALLYASMQELHKTRFIPTYGLLILIIGCFVFASLLFAVYSGAALSCRKKRRKRAKEPGALEMTVNPISRESESRLSDV